jgi:hypothetical protein
VSPPPAPVLSVRPPAAETTPAESPPAKTVPPPFPSILVPAVASPEQSAPRWILTFKLLERLAKGYTWIGSALLLIGLICGWRIFLRPEHLTLFCMNLLLLVVSGIRYWAAGLDLRYFMPMVIVAVPWMALGLEYLIAGTRWFFQRRGELSSRATKILAGSLIAVVAICSFLDGPMSAAAYMRKHAAVGNWVYERAGPEPAIAGTLDHLTLDTFYSHGRVVGTFGPRDCLIVPLPAAITARKADVILLWNEENIAVEYLGMIEERITYYGYSRIAASEFPVGENELMVFVKR